MIQLDYTLSPVWQARSADIDLRTADETDLRYDVLLGDLIFTVGAADFSARWGWVTILDAALAFDTITAALGGEVDQDRFEFTESDAGIDFVRSGDTVTLRSNYGGQGTAEVGYDELRGTAVEFLTRVTRELTREFPDLGENPFVRRLAARLDGPAERSS